MASGDTLFTKSVVDFLHEKYYHHDEVLGKGVFREVLASRSPKQDTAAITIVDNKKMWHIEELISLVLYHKDILSILEMINISYLNVKLFIMPKMRYVLEKMLYNKNFL